MPVRIKGQTFYRTLEVCKKAGISRSTLLRRFDDGTLPDTMHRDKNGWRLFNKADIEKVIFVIGAVNDEN
ncbi:MAG: hypothetical protein HQ553_18090 [Chloroflexi bacterium]|nr:hypothetical protein [Chloroflexota bacterium]